MDLSPTKTYEPPTVEQASADQKPKQTLIQWVSSIFGINSSTPPPTAGGRKHKKSSKQHKKGGKKATRKHRK